MGKPHLKKQRTINSRGKTKTLLDKLKYPENKSIVDKRPLFNEMQLILPWKILKVKNLGKMMCVFFIFSLKGSNSHFFVNKCLLGGNIYQCHALSHWRIDCNKLRLIHKYHVLWNNSSYMFGVICV